MKSNSKIYRFTVAMHCCTDNGVFKQINYWLFIKNSVKNDKIEKVANFKC